MRVLMTTLILLQVERVHKRPSIQILFKNHPRVTQVFQGILIPELH